MKRITVLLIDNFTIVRQGLRLLIEAAGDIEVVAEAKTDREAIQMTHTLHPEVVVMDIVMPFLSGSQATRRILKAFPAAKVLILSANSDSDYVEHIVKAGASGYVVKEASGDVLARAIRELHMGKTFFIPTMAKRFEGKRQQGDNGISMRRKSVADLTSREAEVLPLIAEGHVNKEIASELGISIKTVEKHRQHLMRKLDIHHIAGLTHFAIASGIVACSV
jgi:DNA-binding NarL/FixJ family response regulator